jgi:hypothetical protein
VANWPDFKPGALLRRLVEGGVDFVVVGGVAVIVHASPRFTKDVDICYAPEGENLQALGAVLGELEATLRGIDEDIPFVPDARSLRQTQMLCLDTVLGPIDLLVSPSGSPSYPDLRRRATMIEIEEVEVPVASIEDMLSMKRAAGRYQDLIDVESLEIAQRRLGRRRKR